MHVFDMHNKINNNVLHTAMVKVKCIPIKTIKMHLMDIIIL